MIYLIISIIILTIISSYFIGEISDFFKFNSIITIISGYLTILISYLVKIIIKQKITYINLSKLTNAITKKGINKGLILILFGGIELIVYIFIKLNNKYLKTTSYD